MAYILFSPNSNHGAREIANPVECFRVRERRPLVTSAHAHNVTMWVFVRLI